MECCCGGAAGEAEACGTTMQRALQCGCRPSICTFLPHSAAAAAPCPSPSTRTAAGASTHLDEGLDGWWQPGLIHKPVGGHLLHLF